jgi:hypothetical protein
MDWRFKSSRQTETAAAAIRYWAELVGTDPDSKRAIRWLIAAHAAVLRSAGDRIDGCGIVAGVD